MKNYIQPGKTVTILAPADVASGGVVVAGNLVGIAAGAALSGASVDVALEGVFSIPKVEADAFALGGVVFFNTSTKLATVTATGNTRLGIAIGAASNPSAAVKVRIDGILPFALPTGGSDGQVLKLVSGVPAWAADAT